MTTKLLIDRELLERELLSVLDFSESNLRRVVDHLIDVGYTRAAAAPAPARVTDAARDVLAERQRQISAEGWTPDHDDEHDTGSLAAAAGCYAMYTLAYPAGDPHHNWPWDKAWWKPSADRRRNLVKAGALILAEIERLDRAALPPAPEVV